MTILTMKVTIMKSVRGTQEKIPNPFQNTVKLVRPTPMPGYAYFFFMPKSHPVSCPKRVHFGREKNDGVRLFFHAKKYVFFAVRHRSQGTLIFFSCQKVSPPVGGSKLFENTYFEPHQAGYTYFFPCQKVVLFHVGNRYISDVKSLASSRRF